MMIKNALSLWLAVICCSGTATAQLRARELSDGHPDPECGSYKLCSLINLQTNAEYPLKEDGIVSYNPSEGDRWTIRCNVTGKIEFVKFFKDGVNVSNQYSVPAYIAGDNHGSRINAYKDLKNECGKKEIRVSFHTWRTMDKFPCSIKTFTIKPEGCVTKAPVPAPTPSPTKGPTKAPTKAPTNAPIKAPTKEPTKSYVRSPTDEPTQSPVCPDEKLPKPPTCTLRGNQLCYGYPAEIGWQIEANFHAFDSTFFEMPVKRNGATCITVNSNDFRQTNFWMRFADGCGGSDWTWCINRAVYNPNNPAPSKAPTRFIAPQSAAPVAPSVCPLPPVSPQCYLWSSKLSYGLILPSGTDIEVVTSSGVEFSWPSIPGETSVEVAHLDFARKNFKLRFRNACGASEYKFCKNYTPIALDIDRSGDVEHIMGKFYVDIDGNGDINELQEWFAPTEGILINVDRGIVDGSISGNHMFGDQGGNYTDGYHKLGLLDGNGDEYVSGDELKGLALWTDANSNAKLDDGELSSLEDHHIVALSTRHQDFVSVAILEDGSTMMMEDLWFVR